MPSQKLAAAALVVLLSLAAAPVHAFVQVDPPVLLKSSPGGSLPSCNVVLATDPANDALGGNRGARDLITLRARDNDTTWLLCASVRAFVDRPDAVGDVVVTWRADDQVGTPRYTVDVRVDPDGALSRGTVRKEGVAVPVGDAEAERHGNILEIRVPRSVVGSPADGVLALDVAASTGDAGSPERDDETEPASYRFGGKHADDTPPTRVENLTAEDPRTGSTLLLRWSPAADDRGVAAYVVRRSTVGGGPYQDVATPSTTTYEDTGLETGQRYHYVVVAVDHAGNEGDPSNEASAIPTPPDDPTPPSPPHDLRATRVGTTGASLAWEPGTDPESGVAGHRVWRDEILLAEGVLTSFDDSGLAPETTYRYAVAAVSGTGVESARVALDVTTLPLPPPDCGEVGYELARDAEGDSENGEGRADLLRLAVRERDGRVWFHVSTRGLDAMQTDTRYHVLLQHAGRAYALRGAASDGGTFSDGVYTSIALDGAMVRTSEDLVVQRACATLVLGARLADLGNAADGSVFQGIHVLATTNNTEAATLDRLPDASGVEYLVGSANLPPELDPVGDRTVAEGETLTLVLTATDPDGDDLAYGASGLPQGASFDPSTRTFSWRPTHDEAGTYAGITFTVTDGRARDEEVVAVTVLDNDTTPTLHPIGNRSVPEGETLAFTVHASDADGDAPTLRAAGLPPEATFDAASGLFSWTPPVEAGHEDRAYVTRFEATDGRNVAVEDVTLTATDVNRPPVLSPIGNRAVTEGETLRFDVTASDPDGDFVAVAARGLPSSASFDGTTFTWATTTADVGNHAVEFEASDGSLADLERVVISVGAVNHPPVLDPVPDQVVDEGRTLEVLVAATDADGQALTFSSPNLPVGATLDAATGALRWTPSYDQAGLHPNVEIRATDGEATSAVTFNVNVVDVDRAPTLAAPEPVALRERDTATRALAATDPDGDAVALTAVSLPAWATLTDHGDGTGSVQIAPPSYAEGTYDVVLRATANGLSTEETLRIDVQRSVALDLQRAGSAWIVAAPGQTVTLQATLTNLGSQSDTFDATPAAPPGWSETPIPSVALGPGETTTLTFDVTLPTTGGYGTVSLVARSQANATTWRGTLWSFSTPVTVTLLLEKPSFHVGEEVRGLVRASFADGSPLRGVMLRVNQTPALVPESLRPVVWSAIEGTSNTTGEWSFSFRREILSRLPGEHLIRAEYGWYVFPWQPYDVTAT